MAKQTFGTARIVEARTAQRTAAMGQDTGPYSTAGADTAAPVRGEMLVPDSERGREYAEPPTHAETGAGATDGDSGRVGARGNKGFFSRAVDNIVRACTVLFILPRDGTDDGDTCTDTDMLFLFLEGAH